MMFEDTGTSANHMFEDTGTSANHFISLEEAIIRQAPTPDGWVCPKCKNYKGKLECLMNVFIAFEGANTKNCIWKQT